MTAWESIAKELFSGVMGMGDPSVWMMFLIGGILIYLGVKKDYEPMLLFPMGVGCILANIPGHFAVIPTGGGEPGFLSVLYEAGIANELFPVLIFIAVGAMCEFDPLIRAPSWHRWRDFLSMKRRPSASSAPLTVPPPFLWPRNLPPIFWRR